MLALALGGFSIGATEFVAIGLLPEIAHDLLPALYAPSSEKAIASAGWLLPRRRLLPSENQIRSLALMSG